MHAVIINASPRVRKFSNTDKIIRQFAAGLKSRGGTFEIYSISKRGEWDAAREAYENNNNIIIALPLYVECVPGLLMEFLETLPPKDTKKEKTQMSFILQSGFAEGAQLRFGERYLEKLSGFLGCTYGGTLVKGGNFGIRLAEGKQRFKQTLPYRKMGGIFARDGSFFSKECKRFTGPETFSKPMRIFISLMLKTLEKRAFIKGAKKWGCTKPLDYKPYRESFISFT